MCLGAFGSISGRFGLARLRVRPGRGSANASAWCLAASVFVVSTGQLLSNDHNLDRLLLFGLPTPFDQVAPGSQRLRHLAQIFSALGSPEVVGLFAVTIIGFLALAGHPRAAMFVVCSVVGGAAFAFGLKSGFGVLRPHHPPAGVVTNPSFPSGHTMLATILYFTCAVLVARFARVGAVRAYAFTAASAVTAAVGVSRVLLGVHWPSDVLAGAAAGVMWVALACSFSRISVLPSKLRDNGHGGPMSERHPGG